MNRVIDELRSGGSYTMSIAIVTMVFLVAHAAIFTYGVIHPESFLVGDRADTRMLEIDYVFNGKRNIESPVGDVGSLPSTTSTYFQRLISSGHPGDYAIQGAILTTSNQHIVIVLQLLLSFLATLCIFKLTHLLMESTGWATAATVTYLLLPGSLIHSHHLVSEALFNPLVAIASYLIIYSVQKDARDWKFVIGLVALSVAIFVRPQLMLFPIILAFVLVMYGVSSWKSSLLTVIPVCFLLVGTWSALVFLVQGEQTVGGQDRSVGLALYRQAQRMATAGNFQIDVEAYPGKSMPATDFIQVVVDNPLIYLRQRAIGAVNFLANPGAYAVATHHFRVFDGSGDTTYWGDVRDRSGILGSLLEVLGRGPLFATLILGSALVWSLILLLAFIGAFSFYKDRSFSTASKAILTSLVAYQTLVVMALSVGGRWQQRTPIDFAIIILFVFGARWILQLIRDKRASMVAK